MLLPTDDHMPMPDLPGAVRALTGHAPRYTRCVHLAREGLLPADRIGGRWYARRSEMPAIIAAVL